MKTRIQFAMIPGTLAAAAVSMLAVGAATQQTPSAAQSDNGDHVSIPLSHPGQPATLKVNMLNGSLTVKGYSGKDVVIDTHPAGGENVQRVQRNHDDDSAETQGMHRLSSRGGMTADEEDNVVTVHTSVMGGGEDLVIQVPTNTALELRNTNGRMMEIDDVDGDIDVHATNGRLVLNGVSGSIAADVLNGKVTANIKRLSTAKPSAFTSMNGTIDVTLPADTKATLTLRSDQGSIYMDNNFTFQTVASAPPSGSRNDDGMYKVELNHTIRGNLNGGGTEISFRTFNGSIYVHKAK